MKQHIKDFTLMTAGTLVTALGIYFFKIPNNFCTGGVSGISVILGHISSAVSPESIIAFLNIAFLIVGIMFIGRDFSFKTTYCSIMLSVFVFLLEIVVPINKPLTNQPLLDLFFAIFLSALGSALLFNSDASSGGTDILAMIIKKHSSFNISKALFFADAAIVMSTAFAFGIETWLFSLVGFMAKIVLTNYILEGIHLSKYCTVITSPEYEESVCKFITEKLHRSATVNNSYVGVYGKEKKSVFLVALTGRQASELKRYMKTVDTKAFIVVNNTCEISGKGFRDMI